MLHGIKLLGQDETSRMNPPPSPLAPPLPIRQVPFSPDEPSAFDSPFRIALIFCGGIAFSLLFSVGVYYAHLDSVAAPTGSGNGGSALSLVTLSMLLFPCAVYAASLYLYKAIKQQRRARHLVCACIAVVFGIGFVVAMRVGQKERLAAFPAIAERSRPLVDAIERYLRDNGVPPPSLEALVPRYLSAVPDTGMRAYPRYEYEIDPEYWHGNPWVLYIKTPNIGLNFDRFIYLPLQNYDAFANIRAFERMGDWAYEHE